MNNENNMKEETKKRLSLIAGFTSLAVIGVTVLYAASPEKFNAKYDKIKETLSKRSR